MSADQVSPQDLDAMRAWIEEEDRGWGEGEDAARDLTDEQVLDRIDASYAPGGGVDAWKADGRQFDEDPRYAA